ncbi:MAG TPA: pyridoxal-phosphate dependent enzyme [Flavisolibacter sp.]|jgi:1-aminocyclopropane-1-carboxylate deaminase|nr:pyridoxal-phosphate dependent enzyme [Flavisolibacter sp.]
MLNDSTIHPENIRVDQVLFLQKFHTTVDVLRLDLIHPVISGNKWFKLKEYLREAKSLNKKIILTYGGAYSNHIVATAAAAKQSNFKSIGIIRGEKPTTLSHTLKDAMNFGMEVFFLSREDYKRKIIPPEVYKYCDSEELYVINEGGYGVKGVEGAKAILKLMDLSAYTHILDVVGTGTTIAGIVEASGEHQTVIGISSMKNNFSLQQETEKFISEEKRSRFSLIHDYHFGGYAKYTQELIDFMNEWYRQTGIPSDFVYTGKLFFAAHDLLKKNYFPAGSKLLLMHSGGLQGNLSLPKGTLIF